MGSSHSSSCAIIDFNQEKKVKEYILENSIVCCCIRIGYLPKENIIKKIADKIVGKDYTHSALWVSNERMDDNIKALGLVIEYGNYAIDYDLIYLIENGKIKEIKNLKNYIIYHYGEKGGLRYYLLEYNEFKRLFGSIAFIDLYFDDAHKQKRIEDFLNECAPKVPNVKEEEEWTKNNYKAGGRNCHMFSGEALKLLKPNYEKKNITVNDIEKMSGNDRESILPECIKNALKNNNKNIN